MHITLRPHLMAGVAALVAGAIALTPVTQPELLPSAQRVSAAIAGVTLSGLDSPLTALLDSAILETSYLLNPISPNISPVSNYWQYSGIGPIVQAALGTAALGGYVNLGVLPQIFSDHLPILTQLVDNAAGYLTNIAGNALNDGATLSEALWNLPGALITASEQALHGEFAAALATLKTAIITPLSDVGHNIYSVATTILSEFSSHVRNLAGVIPGLVKIAAVHIVGTLKLAGRQIVAVTSAALAALRSGHLATAWNTAVDGLLAPPGLAGLVLNLTIGAGVQTAPVASPSDIATNFTPSIRTFLQTATKTIAAAIDSPVTGTIPTPAASARAAASVGSPTGTPKASASPKRANPPKAAAAQTVTSATGSSSHPRAHGGR